MSTFVHFAAMRWGAAVLIVLSLAQAADAARRRPRYKHLTRPGRGEAVERLREPGWRPEVKQALEKLITDRGNTAKGYTVDWPPIAVLVLDDVAAAHHAGEVAFLRLVERAEFRFNDAWWKRVPADFRERARRAHKRFTQRSEAVWPHDEDYLDWRKQMFGAYDLLCRRDGRRVCKAWLTQLLAGFSEGEAEAYMRETVDEAVRDPFRIEEIRAHAGDEKPVQAARGLRRVPAMEELARKLLEAGFDVWAISSSNQWVAEVVATRYGIDLSRVVGLRTRVLNQRLQQEVIDPVPIGPGTAEAVVVFIGRDPALVVGDAPDRELLEQGKGLRVAIDRGDAGFNARAAHRGWLLQPPLPVGAAEAR